MAIRTTNQAPLARHASLLAALFLLAGCYTNIEAPGAMGRVVDAATRAPVPGAQITRAAIPAGFRGGIYIPAGGIPATTVLAGKHGRFELPSVTETHTAFLYLRNPREVSATFAVSANGYRTSELTGVARSHHLWRADLGEIPLQRQ